MSLYKDAIAVATVPVTRVPSVSQVQLVKVDKVIPTPHGPVVSGEIVVGEYYPPGNDVGYDGDEIGFGFFKKLGRIAKGGVKIVAKTGKRVVKGTTRGVKWVARNPIKAATLAVPGVATYYAAKAIKKKLKGKGRARPAPALTATQEGQDQAAAMDAAEYGAPGAATPEPPSAPTPPVSEATESQLDSVEDDGGDGADDSDGGSDESEVSGMGTQEWVGLDEIAGDDDVSGDEEYVGSDEIAGARRPMKRKPGPNAALVRQKGYTKKRRQPLAFNSTGTVAAGASATISVIPQTLFRGRKLVVPTAISGSFTIDDLKVGNVSQFAASGSQAAEAFSPQTTGEDNIQMDTCPPGMTLTLSVTNTSGGALQFRATLFGDSVQ